MLTVDHLLSKKKKLKFIGKNLIFFIIKDFIPIALQTLKKKRIHEIEDCLKPLYQLEIICIIILIQRMGHCYFNGSLTVWLLWVDYHIEAPVLGACDLFVLWVWYWWLWCCTDGSRLPQCTPLHRREIMWTQCFFKKQVHSKIWTSDLFGSYNTQKISKPYLCSLFNLLIFIYTLYV